MEMSRSLQRAAWTLPAALLFTIASAQFAQAAANPLGFAYDTTTNVETFNHPTGMLITGRCNRDDIKFKQARAAGAEVLVYIDAVDEPLTPACAVDDEFYHPNGATTPRWVPARTNWKHWPLTDISKDSAWSDHVVAYIESLMTDPNIDGVFLDVVGAQLWSDEADWDNWPAAEKDLWTSGNVDLVKRLDASRRAINPRFIIVNNNFWYRDGSTLGLEGEQYVDGICSEHHDYVAGQFHANYVQKPFSNLGHRRVLAIARSATDATNWRNAPGVTHVSRQYSSDYGSPPAASASEFTRLTDRPKTFGRTSIAATPSAGMTANQKRGSRFSLTENATLLSFSAYMDGNGGASGTQAVRMVLYKDSGGAPGAKVAESSTMNVASGSAAKWYTFSAPAAPLTPGDYWIVIHTGTTTILARNRGDGAANWYGNADTFSDGAADPFGAGSTGSVTLSVYVSYTVGN